ncbi:MAG: cytochrome c peroxidase [Asticcacaulis sp.]
MRIPKILIVAGVLLAFAGAGFDRSGIADLRAAYSGAPETWPRPELQDGAVFEEFGVLPAVVAPADNLPTPQKVALGQRLFNDPVLSGSRQIACASCHSSELAFADGVKTPFGHDRQRGRRNSISLITAGWQKTLFWDGRAASLEAQAEAPIIDHREMNAKPSEVLRRLNRDETYREEFSAAFGVRRITMHEVSQALAVFQRTLKPRLTKWDRVLANGTQTLTDQELLGLDLFRRKAGCANCHNGPLFSDQQFHNLGLTMYGRRLEDLGRYEVTKNPADVGKFKTPSLRNVSRTAPYMHNGTSPTLEGIINLYDEGGGRPKRDKGMENDPMFPVTSPMLKPLGLTDEEKAALVAYLRTL